jgi:hypothetical protein
MIDFMDLWIPVYNVIVVVRHISFIQSIEFAFYVLNQSGFKRPVEKKRYDLN